MTEHTFPHLSAVLDAGQLPTDENTTDTLVAAAVDIGTGVDIERRARVLESVLESVHDTDPDGEQAVMWAVDLLRCPDLAPRVLDALGADAAAEAWWRIECEQRPYPIFAGPRVNGERPGRWWKCCNCGAGHENSDPAVVITGRSGWSDDLEDPITYCADCIRNAADALTNEGNER